VEPASIIARAESVRGEVVLRRRAEPPGQVDELIVNGAFAMDSAEAGSERALGRLARGAGRVLLGGLGLGYTAAELLDRAVGQLDIVELEQCLIDWARDGVTDTLRQVAGDPRVHLHCGDVAVALAGIGPPTGPWDAVLLDVDNGPDFLIHRHNAALYEAPLLTAAYDQLRPDGLLAVWCQGESPELEATLHGLGGTVDGRRFEVERGERRLTYVIYTLRKADSVP
jgi:spermidine synthase